PPGDVLVAAGLLVHGSGRPVQERSDTDVIGHLIAARFGDLSEVYTTRAEFAANLPPQALFRDVEDVKAWGLSLNLMCLQYGDKAVRRLIEDGTRMRCLFLDPFGSAIKSREVEEGYPTGHLSALTQLNIQVLTKRVRDRLDDDSRERLEIGTYNETIRFNITI